MREKLPHEQAKRRFDHLSATARKRGSTRQGRPLQQAIPILVIWAFENQWATAYVRPFRIFLFYYSEIIYTFAT